MPFSRKITSGSYQMQRLAYPVCALLFAGLFLSMFLNTASPDLSALFQAGHAVSTGQSSTIYALGSDPLKAEALYVYPPLWAWLIAPLTQQVSFEAFSKAMFYAHVTMLCASVGLAWKVVCPPHMKSEHFIFVSFALLALSAPVFQALGQNQPQILTLFLVLLAFERYRAGSFAMAGMILAVAAAFKLSPLFLVLIFILERNGRATIAFVATGLSLALMSLALAGWPMHLRFLELIAEIDNVIILSNTNYAPELLLYQLQAFASGAEASSWSMSQTMATPEPFWLSVFMAALMLSALTALILMRPRLIAGTAVPVLLMGFALATALFGPASWGHYFVLPLLLLPTLFHILPRLTAWRWIIALGLLQSFPAYLIYFEMSEALYVTTLMGVLCFGGLLLALVSSVFRAVRFEPDVPMHFR